MQKDIEIAASSAALLRTLLSDRRSKITHDELSRSLWASLDVTFPIDKLIDGILKLASSESTSERACQPLLVGMMDVLELLVSYPEGNRSSLLERNTERIESLIEMMSARPESNIDLSLSMEEINDHTPTANNLSRIDESHISLLEPVAEPSKPPTGLEDTIRIAAATVLVHMADGASMTTESTVAIWRTRIRTAVLDFISTIRLHGRRQASANMKRRLFHLQAVLASSSTENEDVIASSLIDEDLLCRRERDDNAQQLIDCQRQLDEARAQVKELEAERDKYKKAVRLQVATFDRDIQRSKSKAILEASQLVEVHAAERRAAENRAEACVRRAKHIEELQKEAESCIEEFKSLEANAKQQLHDLERKLKATQDELQQQRTLVDEQKRRCSDQVKELSNYKDRLQIVEGEHKTTRSHLSASQAALNETNTAYNKLADDLEETFSQLSLLAQAYQTKEDEITSIVEKKDRAIQEARRSADSELRRNDDLEATERHLQFENDRLTKKLERAKQKLEDERNLQQEESDRRKRHGPVSYINQLHTSTTSAASRAPRGGSTSRRENSRGPGKENGYCSSSSSLRRENSYNSSSSLRRDYR